MSNGDWFFVWNDEFRRVCDDWFHWSGEVIQKLVGVGVKEEVDVFIQ